MYFSRTCKETYDIFINSWNKFFEPNLKEIFAVKYSFVVAIKKIVFLTYKETCDIFIDWVEISSSNLI